MITVNKEVAGLAAAGIATGITSIVSFVIAKRLAKENKNHVDNIFELKKNNTALEERVKELINDNDKQKYYEEFLESEIAVLKESVKELREELKNKDQQ